MPSDNGMIPTAIQFVLKCCDPDHCVNLSPKSRFFLFIIRESVHCVSRLNTSISLAQHDGNCLLSGGEWKKRSKRSFGRTDTLPDMKFYRYYFAVYYLQCLANIASKS